MVRYFFQIFRFPYRDRAEIESLQLTKLKQLLWHAKDHVEFYQKKYATIDLNSIKSLSDIGKLPFSYPLEFRKDDPTPFITKSADRSRLISTTTSGTISEPMKFFISKEEDRIRQLKSIRFQWQHGWKPWWKGAHVWRTVEKKHHSVFQKLIENRRQIISINWSPKEQVQKIFEVQPDFIFGMTSSLEVLADWMIRHGLSYNAKLVYSGGNVKTSKIAEKFRLAFGHPGEDRYGSVECGLIGYSCPYSNLNYFDEDGYIVEILDEQDQPVKPGERGSIVITALDQYTMPFIRYKIGDYARLAESGSRSNINYTLYQSIEGRETDKITFKDGRVRTGQHLISPLMKVEGILKFQFYQNLNGDVTLKYIKKENIDTLALEEQVLRYTGLTRDLISFNHCMSIPLEPSGKFKEIKLER
ncbi:hypothetical protein QQ008_28670 [Fulvivirgaceae bacterium BMA10]|uniref:Phenylacetate--CoA ligase family protein n=1 Tax=Splendidivirga corallicola TaxID=3051826 RepID=A0ABT8KYG2_9BACT|nr:hypothetical protein [Fulvivirgaceae bacterium BMA10]